MTRPRTFRPISCRGRGDSKNTPTLDIGPFKNVLGGDSSFMPPINAQGGVAGPYGPASQIFNAQGGTGTSLTGH